MPLIGDFVFSIFTIWRGGGTNTLSNFTSTSQVYTDHLRMETFQSTVFGDVFIIETELTGELCVMVLDELWSLVFPACVLFLNIATFITWSTCGMWHFHPPQVRRSSGLWFPSCNSKEGKYQKWSSYPSWESLTIKVVVRCVKYVAETCLATN